MKKIFRKTEMESATSAPVIRYQMLLFIGGNEQYWIEKAIRVYRTRFVPRRNMIYPALQITGSVEDAMTIFPRRGTTTAPST